MGTFKPAAEQSQSDVMQGTSQPTPAMSKSLADSLWDEAAAEKEHLALRLLLPGMLSFQANALSVVFEFPGMWSRSEQGSAYVALSIPSPHPMRTAGLRRFSDGAGGVVPHQDSKSQFHAEEPCKVRRLTR